MKITPFIILYILMSSELILAQTYQVGVSYHYLIDKSQNVTNNNIVDYQTNNRLEINLLNHYWYGHLAFESLSFSENSVITNSTIDNISYLNNPGNLYDLSYLNLGLGWNAQPYKWLRLISGFTTGFLVHSSINFNDKLFEQNNPIYPLNNLESKKDAINKLRLTVFQSVELNYEIWKSINLVIGYKFEVPITPLIRNDNASIYFRQSNEASENYLQFLSLGVRYGW